MLSSRSFYLIRCARRVPCVVNVDGRAGCGRQNRRKKGDREPRRPI